MCAGLRVVSIAAVLIAFVSRPSIGSAQQMQSPAAQHGALAPRVASAYCAPPSSQAVNPAGGLLIGPSCGGVAGLFYYGANNASTLPSSYNQITTSTTVPLSATLNGGLPAPPIGSMPLAYFEVVGISSSPTVTYGPPATDRSLVESTSITKGSLYEIIGYDFESSGSNIGFHVVYQSNAMARSDHILYIASPLSGLTLPQLSRTYFVLLKIVAEFPIPSAYSEPTGIAAGPDGALWFAESQRDKIGRVTTDGVFTEYATPTSLSSPWQIASGPDGALWFTERAGHQIGRVTTSGVISEYAIPTASSFLSGIAAGPDGALWFTEDDAGNVGRITTSGAVTEYPIPTVGSWPEAIAAGPDGALWFTESDPDGGGKIGRITTSGVITEYALPTDNSHPNYHNYPWGIAAGPDGALWFTLAFNRIGRITTGGAVTEYALATLSMAFGYGIAAGPDGALWFTELNGNKIGRITTGGAFTEYAVRTQYSQPWDIVAGPDRELWYTEYSGANVGRIPVGAASNVHRRAHLYYHN